MPLVVWLSLAAAVIVTVAALAWTLRALIGRITRLGADLDRLQRELTPTLRQLEADSTVTSAELAALGDRLEARSLAGRARTRRRWRPRLEPPAR